MRKHLYNNQTHSSLHHNWHPWILLISFKLDYFVQELRMLKQSSLGSLWSYEGSVGPLISPEMAESLPAVIQR